MLPNTMNELSTKGRPLKNYCLMNDSSATEKGNGVRMCVQRFMDDLVVEQPVERIGWTSCALSLNPRGKYVHRAAIDYLTQSEVIGLGLPIDYMRFGLFGKHQVMERYIPYSVRRPRPLLYQHIADPLVLL